MSTPTRDDLLTIIDTDGLTPDSVRRLNDEARELFRAAPSLQSFVAHSVFRTLSDVWDDPQAVPSAHFNQVQSTLLPRLRIWLQSDVSFTDPQEMQRVTAALHACL